jgi:hypothetical protein
VGGRLPLELPRQPRGHRRREQGRGAVGWGGGVRSAADLIALLAARTC